MADLVQRETLCFQKTNQTGVGGKECFVPCPFKYVRFGENPDRYLMPVNHSPLIGLDYTPAVPVVDGIVFEGVEIFESLTTPWEETQEFHFV